MITRRCRVIDTALQLCSISSRHASIDNITKDTIIGRHPIILAIYYTVASDLSLFR